MTLQATDDKWQARREEWVDRVTRLMDKVEQWSLAEGWSVHREQKAMKESVTGEYRVPTLRLRNVDGDIFVKPVGLHIVGADGRIDVETWPTLNRVKLLGKPKGWQIMTDSNVPLRERWGRETFLRLVRDLQSNV